MLILTVYVINQRKVLVNENQSGVGWASYGSLLYLIGQKRERIGNKQTNGDVLLALEELQRSTAGHTSLEDRSS